MTAGITSYGAWVPRYRITSDEIARAWGDSDAGIGRGINVIEKSVAGPDEDTTTLSVEAARLAMSRVGADPRDIGAIFVGSESHVYAVKPTATMLGAALGAGPTHTSADFEFACKAGTAAVQACMGLTASGYARYGMAVGSDTSQGAPGDVLEHTASAGAAAFLVGTEDLIAEVRHTTSFTSDTPDFWRREGERYPVHAARFTGAPAYFRHVLGASSALFEMAGTGPEDYDYAVFHQPNGKFPRKVAARVGFSAEQVEPGLLAPLIGNTYSGAVLLGLAAILDVAAPGERIFVCGYGSGAGSDAFDLVVTDRMADFDRNPTLRELIDANVHVDYATYARFRGKIEQPEAP